MKSIFIKLSILIIVLYSALCCGCNEKIDLDLEQAPAVYVVDALITDSTGYNYVKLSKSVDFYYEGSAPAVETATIQVTDSEGNIYDYVFDEEEQAYLPNPMFVGVVGHSYELTINVEGEVITATDSMRYVTSVDDVSWRENESSLFDEEEDDTYKYEVLVDAKEPQETEDYYLFKFYRNDTIQRYDSETGIFYSDDVGIGEDINDLSGPVLFALEDEARVEIYSLTAEAFKYYYDLDQLINSDGGMFGGIPANPSSNLNNENAVGFFQVSAVSRMDIVVGDPDKAWQE